MSERKVEVSKAKNAKQAPRRGLAAREQEREAMRALVRRRASALRELAKH